MRIGSLTTEQVYYIREALSGPKISSAIATSINSGEMVILRTPSGREFIEYPENIFLGFDEAQKEVFKRRLGGRSTGSFKMRIKDVVFYLYGILDPKICVAVVEGYKERTSETLLRTMSDREFWISSDRVYPTYTAAEEQFLARHARSQAPAENQ